MIPTSAAEILPSVKTTAELEAAMLQMPQVSCPIVHTFMPGIYIREMHAPAGTLLLGHEHKKAHACLLLKGTLEVVNENGTTTLLEAPMLFEGKPGRKKALAHTDVVFCNMHATEETDIAKLEEEFVTKSDIWQAHQAKLEGK